MTGTNGKTSIANFYHQIMSLNNKKVASIGTLGVLSKKFNLKTNNTTIDPVNIHKILQRLKKLGVDNVIIEASSHGLKQHRMDNINFKTAMFTNLSRDHLDYHKTIKDYLNSKLILFNKLVNTKGNIIFDNIIKETRKLKKISKKRKLKKYTFGSTKSFIRITNIQKFSNQSKIDCIINKKNTHSKHLLLEKFKLKI